MQLEFLNFGELLIRLSAPGRELLLQSPELRVHIGGAEANVAVSLARLGHRVGMVSVVPDNALGAAAAGELRRHGVDTQYVRIGSGRMGLYFLVTGAIHRPSDVLYDRAHSAFANAPRDVYDWRRLLDGVQCLHLSGVTPALGKECAAAAISAARQARERGVFVSFDGNFRAKLWAAWDSDPPTILRELMAQADIIFGDYRDIGIALGEDFSALPAGERQAAAARAAFAAFPHLQRLTSTHREQRTVDDHQLSAVMSTRERLHQTEAYTVSPIVDRIGGGDAFAAGVLHGLRRGLGDAESLRFGLAAACLKHSVPGDFNLIGEDEVRAFLGERGFDVKR